MSYALFNSILLSLLFATAMPCCGNNLLENPIKRSSINLQMTIDLAEQAVGELKHGDMEQAKRDIRKLQVIGQNYHEEVSKISDLLQDQKRILEHALKESEKLQQNKLIEEQRLRNRLDHLAEQSRVQAIGIADLETKVKHAETEVVVNEGDVSRAENDNKAKSAISGLVSGVAGGALAGAIPGGLTGPGGMIIGAIVGAIAGYNGLGEDTNAGKESIATLKRQIEIYRKEIDEKADTIRSLDEEIKEMKSQVEKDEKQHSSLKKSACRNNNSITVVNQAQKYFTLIRDLEKDPDDEMYHLEVIISGGKIKVFTITECDDVSKLSIVNLVTAWTMVQVTKENCDANSCSGE